MLPSSIGLCNVISIMLCLYCDVWYSYDVMLSIGLKTFMNYVSFCLL